jgi:methionyl-tRNA formyltransferase
MAPTPGAFTTLESEALRILAATHEPGAAGSAPGTVRNRAGAPLAVATGDGWLLPTRLQRAGGKPLAIDAFLRGRPLPDGTKLG